MHKRSFNILNGLLVFVCCSGASTVRAALQVSPASVTLDNPEATQQLLVHPAGSTLDITRAVKYEVLDPKVAAIDATGLVRPTGEGKTSIVIRSGQEQVRVEVSVTGLTKPPPVCFETQIMPILTKTGCNSGGCHGKAEGKNGFKLSVFGFDPVADHQALVVEARGRRLFASAR